MSVSGAAGGGGGAHPPPLRIVPGVVSVVTVTGGGGALVIPAIVRVIRSWAMGMGLWAVWFVVVLHLLWSCRHKLVWDPRNAICWII